MKNTYVLFMEKNTQHRINLNSILYVRTNRRYTTMYAGKKLYHFNATLEELMADPSLDCLVQIHRCFAINMNQVTAINRTEIFIEDLQLPLGRTLAQKAYEAFVNTT